MFVPFAQKRPSSERSPAQVKKNFTLQEVADWLLEASEDLITLNPRPLPPQTPEGASASATFNFTLDETNSWLTPDAVLKPEYVQSLFAFDTQAFIQSQKTETFLNAKTLYYRKFKYDFKHKLYELSYPILSDWGGLNHPPLINLTKDDLAWITSYSTEKVTSLRDEVSFQRKIDQLSQSELSLGNKFSPFFDKAVVDELLAIIKKTQKTLWISALLYSCDPHTEAITLALEDKAKQGVDVRLMVDRTMQLLQENNCTKRLRKSGLKVVLVPGMVLKKSAFHVKLWMRDFKEGLFLGANIIDIQTLATGFNHLFHDSGVRVEGPLISDMARHFLDFWSIYEKENSEDQKLRKKIENLIAIQRIQNLRGESLYENWSPQDYKQRGLCRVVTQERHSQRDRVSLTLLEYLKTAKKRIWFSSVRRDFHETHEHPEIGYNELLLTALAKAKNEQVQVEMIFNASSNPTSISKIKNSGLPPAEKKRLVDKLLSHMMMKSTDKALRDGATFFEKAHQEAPLFRAWSYFTYSHIKNLMIDDDFVITGSYNPMDERSTNDAEIALLCQDEELNFLYSFQHAKDLVNALPYPFASQIK